MANIGSTVEARLSELLLELCISSRQTDRGTEVQFLLTYEEIAWCIGSSRETVIRALNDLKNLGLVEQNRSILIVPDRSGLANHAGIGLCGSKRNEFLSIEND
jgi:CRP-like cAMP-binding protein